VDRREIWRSGFRELEIEGSGRVGSKFKEVLLKRIIETKSCSWGRGAKRCELGFGKPRDSEEVTGYHNSSARPKTESLISAKRSNLLEYLCCY
jgi:hypothetical protein